MISAFPDNQINAELKTRLNNLDVNGTIFKYYVKNVTSDNQKFYFLKSTQITQPEFNKCGTGHITSTEIQVTVILSKNKGSELILNNAVAALYSALDGFSLDAGTGLVVNRSELSVDNDLTEKTGANIVYRKIVRLETHIR